MTGRAAGWCAGYDRAGFSNPGWGFGCGRGGRGRGRGFYAAPHRGWMRTGGFAAAESERDPGLEKQALSTRERFLQSELESIRARKSEIETGGTQE